MRLYSKLLLLALLILAACTSDKYGPRGTAKNFIIAVIDNDTYKEASMLYNSQDSLPSENIRRKSVFNKEDIEKLEFTPVNNYPTEFPNYSVNCYQVTAGDRTAYINVVQDNSGEYKILSSKGLFSYDYSDISGNLKCNLVYDNDQEMTRAINIMERDLSIFRTFSDAVAAADSAEFLSIFPALKGHRYNFKNAPVPLVYTQNFNPEGISSRVVACLDSTSYVFGADTLITDCLNIIPTDDIAARITAVGKKPLPRKSMNDIDYIVRLKKQYTDIIDEQQRREWEIKEENARKARELAAENERKARAAKIKSQGAALISSSIIGNGNGAKGIKYTVLNTSQKTAKYVIVEVVGYNAVDDPVLGVNGYLNRCSGIGPVKPGEIYSWEFDKIWERGDLVNSYEIKNLIIQFTDGTSKRIKLPTALPPNWRDWLY